MANEGRIAGLWRFPRAVFIVGLFSASAVIGQVSLSPEKPEGETGIPVTDALTIEKCGGCPTADEKGNLSRISWVRTTPEYWSQVIKRMVTLNGLQITPAESRQIVRYLANNHGLAPEEAKPVMYLPEHRLVDETNIPSESLRGACAACHSMAQPLSWRRSAKEWQLLQDFHVALYSQADAQFRRPASDEPGGVFGQTTPITPKPGTKPVTQGQIALDYMRRTAPLTTPEWTQWTARRQVSKLEGKWLVNATSPGKPPMVGTMVITPSGKPDEYATAITLRSPVDGKAMTRTGNGIVYTGYAWRGRSDVDDAKPGPASLDNPTREAMWFAPDRRSAQGRWYWGAYQEFGYDVKLVRADGAPVIAGVFPTALKAGSRDVEVRIIGDSLAAASTADVDLGAGVTVNRIVSASPTDVVVSVSAAATATPGAHDVAVGSAVLGGGLPVYRGVDYVKVMPETAISRLGGARFARGYEQFEAIGFDKGADGKPHTPDDIRIGSVAADWSLEEFQSTWYDDDKDFVGTIDQAALFTPNLDGPNAARSNNRNNYGDVWVVATARDAKDPQGKPLKGKGFLVVTVPSYKRWDNPEVSK